MLTNQNLTQDEVDGLKKNINAFESRNVYNPKLDINNDGQVSNEEIEVLKILELSEQKKINDQIESHENQLANDFDNNNFIHFNNTKVNKAQLNQTILNSYDEDEDGQMSYDELKKLNNSFTTERLVDLDQITDKLSSDEKLAYENFINQEKAQKSAAVAAMTQADRDTHYTKYIAEIFNVENTNLNNPNQIFGDRERLSKRDLIVLDQIINNQLVANNIGQKKYDLDFDQSVDGNEISYFIKFRDAYYKHVENETGKAGYDQLALNFYDTNGNGIIDMDEFAKLEKRQNYFTNNNITNKSNRSVDLDGTRHISLAEETAITDLYNTVKASFQSFYNANTQDDIAEMKMDLNGNGVIDRNEAKLLNQMVNSGNFDAKYDLDMDGVVDNSEKNVYANLNTTIMNDKSSEFADMSAQGKEHAAQKKFDLNLDGELSAAELEELRKFSNNNSYSNNIQLDLDGDFTVSAEEELIYENLLTTHTTNKVNEFTNLSNEQKKGLAFIKLRSNNNPTLNHTEMLRLRDIVAGNISNNSYDLNGDGVFTSADKVAYQLLLTDLDSESTANYQAMTDVQKKALAFDKFDSNGDDKLDDQELEKLSQLLNNQVQNKSYYDLNNNQSFDDLGGSNLMDEKSIYQSLYDDVKETNRKDFKTLFSDEEQLKHANQKLKSHLEKITGQDSINDDTLLKFFRVDDGMTSSEKNTFISFILSNGLELNLNDDHNFISIDNNKVGSYDVNDLYIYVKMLEKMVEENNRIKNILNNNP